MGIVKPALDMSDKRARHVRRNGIRPHECLKLVVDLTVALAEKHFGPTKDNLISSSNYITPEKPKSSRKPKLSEPPKPDTGRLKKARVSNALKPSHEIKKSNKSKPLNAHKPSRALKEPKAPIASKPLKPSHDMKDSKRPKSSRQVKESARSAARLSASKVPLHSNSSAPLLRSSYNSELRGRSDTPKPVLQSSGCEKMDRLSALGSSVIVKNKRGTKAEKTVKKSTKKQISSRKRDPEVSAERKVRTSIRIPLSSDEEDLAPHIGRPSKKSMDPDLNDQKSSSKETGKAGRRNSATSKAVPSRPQPAPLSPTNPALDTRASRSHHSRKPTSAKKHGKRLKHIQSSSLDLADDSDLDIVEEVAPVKKSPEESILAFAKGHEASLTSAKDPSSPNTFHLRTSLATIKGCDRYKNINIFAYIKSLCEIHMPVLKSISQKSQSTSYLNGNKFDSISSEIGTSEWKKVLSSHHYHGLQVGDEGVPPMISRTLDVMMFILRLLQAMLRDERSTAETFIEHWYSSQLTHLVGQLSTKVLVVWFRIKRQDPKDGHQSRLVEWSLRLTSSFLVYEISPISSLYQGKKIPDSNLFMNFFQDKRYIPHIMARGFDYISSLPSGVGRECKSSVADIVQVFMIRYNCQWEHEPQRTLWSKAQEIRKETMDLIVSRSSFWTVVVHSALLRIRKQEKIPDACFEVAFLYAIVSDCTTMRALLEQQVKSRELVVEITIRILEGMGRDPLGFFSNVESHQRLYTNLPSAVDVVRVLMSSAVLQRELVSAGAVMKEKYLAAIAALIMRCAKYVPTAPGSEELLKAAKRGSFAHGTEEHVQELENEDKPMQGFGLGVGKKRKNPRNTEREASIQRVLGFVTFLIGSLGKSMEDGSRDISQMNSLKALITFRFNNSRMIMRLWEAVFGIQRALEKRIAKKESHISTSDRNFFSMVVEGIRRRVVSDHGGDISCVSIEGPLEANSKGVSAIAPQTKPVNASFPDIGTLREVQAFVSTNRGFRHLDEDPDVLGCIQKTLTESGQQVMARYDPNSSFTTKWVKLQKRNSYLEGAREELDKEDKTVGQRCSCVPGNPKEGNGDKRIACSNDLCENRSSKVECGPGECGAGAYCQNRRMQKLEYAMYKMVAFPGKGVGMVADEDIKPGALIGEYQGEVLTMKMFKQREKEYFGERHFYFMTLVTGKLVIDASRKSQATRFLNHSCDPNAETQKWNADGEPRVGIFAKRAIACKEEITFDYGARSVSKDSAPCKCGAEKCRGRLTLEKEGSGQDVAVKSVEQSGLHVNSPDKEDVEAEHERLAKIVERRLERAKVELSMAKELEKLQEMLLTVSKKAKAFDIHHATCSEKKRLHDWKERRMASLQSDGKRKKPVTKSCTSSAVAAAIGGNVQTDYHIPRLAKSEGIVKGKANSQVSGVKAAVSSARVKPVFPSTGVKNVADKGTVSAGVKAFVPSAGMKATMPSTEVGGHSLDKVQAPKAAPVKKSRTEEPPPRRTFLRAFAPTSSRHKKVPRKPKVTPRKRTGLRSPDSMDEYSTCSEAEPLYEKPIWSPTHVPEPACSADEFEAAKPIREICERREVSDNRFQAGGKPPGGNGRKRGREAKFSPDPYKEAARRQPLWNSDPYAPRGQDSRLPRSSHPPAFQGNGMRGQARPAEVNRPGPYPGPNLAPYISVMGKERHQQRPQMNNAPAMGRGTQGHDGASHLRGMQRNEGHAAAYAHGTEMQRRPVMGEMGRDGRPMHNNVRHIRRDARGLQRGGPGDSREQDVKNKPWVAGGYESQGNKPWVAGGHEPQGNKPWVGDRYEPQANNSWVGGGHEPQANKPGVGGGYELQANKPWAGGVYDGRTVNVVGQEGIQGHARMGQVGRGVGQMGDVRGTRFGDKQLQRRNEKETSGPEGKAAEDKGNSAMVLARRFEQRQRRFSEDKVPEVKKRNLEEVGIADGDANGKRRRKSEGEINAGTERAASSVAPQGKRSADLRILLQSKKGVPK